MPQSKPAEEIEIILTPDGTAATYWWTEESGKILDSLGTPAPGLETVNNFQFCG
jgi:hypothetical protein